MSFFSIVMGPRVFRFFFWAADAAGILPLGPGDGEFLDSQMRYASGIEGNMDTNQKGREVSWQDIIGFHHNYTRHTHTYTHRRVF